MKKVKSKKNDGLLQSWLEFAHEDREFLKRDFYK